MDISTPRLKHKEEDWYVFTMWAALCSTENNMKDGK